MDRSQIPLIKIFYVIFLGLLTSLAFASPKEESFRFYLKSEPRGFDPTLVVGGESTYVLSQLYRGLTRFDGSNQLIFDQAKTCRFKSETELNCELRKEARWSDETPVVADDFVKAFRNLVSPESRCPVVNLLFGVKNAKDIFTGKISPEKLGVNATSPHTVQFLLTEKDTEFLEKLSSPLLIPYNANKTNGPYKIKSWVKTEKIILEPFESYFGAKAHRPLVEIYFASEDSAALTLYEKGVINFLWRVTTVNIPKYVGRPDFIQVPVARYDYIGFNLRPGSLFEKRALREAFAKSLNFEDFKKAFFALGAPGCPGLGEPFLNPIGHCVEFESPSPKIKMPPINFMFSQLGGDDIKRQAEWFQQQWNEHLGVTLKVKSMEQKQYLDLLSKNPPDAFRTGVALNRPSCLAALERFKTGSSDNYVGFSNAHFDKLLDALSHQKLSLSEKESVCGVASDILFKEEFVGIPLGRIHFTMLVNPHFKGWTLNELNQLDLSQLSWE